MKNITKAQLAAENDHLRHEVARLKAQLEAERELLLTSEETKKRELLLARAKGRGIGNNVPEHMRLAREMAMRSGITVKVG